MPEQTEGYKPSEEEIQRAEEMLHETDNETGSMSRAEYAATAKMSKEFIDQLPHHSDKGWSMESIIPDWNHKRRKHSLYSEKAHRGFIYDRDGVAIGTIQQKAQNSGYIPEYILHLGGRPEMSYDKNFTGIPFLSTEFAAESEDDATKLTMKMVDLIIDRMQSLNDEQKEELRYPDKQEEFLENIRNEVYGAINSEKTDK